MQSIIGKLHYSGVGAIARATVKCLSTSASVTGEVAVSTPLMQPQTILSPFFSPKYKQNCKLHHRSLPKSQILN